MTKAEKDEIKRFVYMQDKDAVRDTRQSDRDRRYALNEGYKFIKKQF